jgi:hypothetical protein
LQFCVIQHWNLTVHNKSGRFQAHFFYDIFKLTFHNVILLFYAKSPGQHHVSQILHPSVHLSVILDGYYLLLTTSKLANCTQLIWHYIHMYSKSFHFLDIMHAKMKFCRYILVLRVVVYPRTWWGPDTTIRN